MTLPTKKKFARNREIKIGQGVIALHVVLSGELNSGLEGDLSCLFSNFPTLHTFIKYHFKNENIFYIGNVTKFSNSIFIVKNNVNLQTELKKFT